MNKISSLVYKDLLKAQKFVLVPKGDYKAFFEVEIKKVIPVVKPTATEKLAIERSRREFASGEYLTLDEFDLELAHNRTKKRSKAY